MLINVEQLGWDDDELLVLQGVAAVSDIDA